MNTREDRNHKILGYFSKKMDQTYHINIIRNSNELAPNKHLLKLFVKRQIGSIWSIFVNYPFLSA